MAITHADNTISNVHYIEATNSILNATNNIFDSIPIFLGGKHLVYNNVLNFSTFYRIESKGTYKIELKLMHIGQTTLTNLDLLMLMTVSLITLNLET